MSLLAVVAAVPSLVWTLSGAGYLTDDWFVWSVLDQDTLDGLRTLAFEVPGRPLAAPYYAFTYLGLGHNIILHGLVIAAINTALVVAAWMLGRDHLPGSVLLPALCVLALGPNRSATRFWFVVGTYPLALLLTMLALWLLFRNHAVAAAVILATSVLLYEGQVALALTVIGLWALGDVRERLRDAMTVAGPTVCVSAVSFLLSSKRGPGGPGVFENSHTFVPAQVGVGLLENSYAARVGALIVILAVAASAALLLPSFRSDLQELHYIRLGALLAVAGAVPFFVAGAVFATDGIFDRNNLVPGVGIAILIGGVWSLLHRWAPAFAIGGGLCLLAWFVVLNLRDVSNYVAAVDNGEAVMTALEANAAPTEGEPLLIVPAQDDEGGVANFVYSDDVVAAMHHRTGQDWSGLKLLERVDCSDFPADRGTVDVFDWRRGRLYSVEGDQLPRRCEEWRRWPAHT